MRDIPSTVLDAYEHDVLVGGNHLASALLAAGINPPSLREADYDDVLEKHGQPTADIWVAWKAIMNWRDAKERFV